MMDAYNLLRTHWQQQSQQLMAQYTQGQHDFVIGLLPEMAVQLPGHQVLACLAQRLGVGPLQSALSPGSTFESPVARHTNTDWIKRVNMVGVNVRTVQSFWNVVKYALTLPAAQSSIHLLPMWEPGVVASLYGMASWNINPEFYSPELAHLVPQLNTVELQLKAVVNLLHAMGKTVGMDVIPHTDRYSEMALAQPHFFEWLQRKDDRIIAHHAQLHESVQGAILSWLVRHGAADPSLDYPREVAAFFGSDMSEATRLQVLFGKPHQYRDRLDRRASLVDWLFHKGYEPVPATMGPPYRGLEVDPDPAARVVDYAGREWRDYRITQPQAMSRVFGPLTRYKFYEAHADNADWAIDFANPRTEVWDYFCRGYANVQADYNLDFMRGDMSHVQMRPDGVPSEQVPFYDPLGSVKLHIQERVPYFGYFAESFLAPPGVMAYGDELDHLEASYADTTLGDLQSTTIGEATFMADFRRYLDIQATRQVVPNFTILTGDKDDPRFDAFYLHGNEARLWMGLFITDLPSYQALGFEQRDPHPTPAPNEHYTKLYVFHLDEGPKATQGPYQWGKNGILFQRILYIRQMADALWPKLANCRTQWLVLPEVGQLVIAWTQQERPQYIFLQNVSADTSVNAYPLPIKDTIAPANWHVIGSTHRAEDTWPTVTMTTEALIIETLIPGEGIVLGI